jgi:transposase
MKLHALGIDLGKTVFHLVGLDSTGRVVIRKRCSRPQLLAFTANLQVQLIGMEACSGAHFLGRALREQGHEVRLMPAQYVKPYVQTNKSDYLDAEAIAEAVQRPRMRFVPIKTEEQLDLQALHRVRERWVMRRTAVVNQIRSLLLERGLTLPKSRHDDLKLTLWGSHRSLAAWRRGVFVPTVSGTSPPRNRLLTNCIPRRAASIAGTRSLCASAL